MNTDLTTLFSERAKRIKPSAIRKMVPLLREPGIISFAGGWPAADLFPTAEIAEITAHIMAHEGAAALQYGPSLGDDRLRQQVLDRLARVYGLQAPLHEIMITTGAQQALYLIAKVLLDEGDVVVVEAPSYVGVFSVFASFGGEVVSVPMDEEGLDTAALEKRLAAGLQVKMIYTVPDYQNPTGLSMSLARRQKLVELAAQYNFIIIEDAPYADLRYEGDLIAPLYTLDARGHTVYVGSFSKIFAPMRVGWLIAPEALVAKAAVVKQPIDLCTPSLTQAIAYHYCQRGLLETQIERTKALYKKKRDVLLGSLDRHMPAAVEWTNPKGGMFIWVTLPEQLTAEDLLYEAINDKVAFVIGSAFYPEGGDVLFNTLRLNFATPTEEQIAVGIKRLGDLFARHLST